MSRQVIDWPRIDAELNVGQQLSPEDRSLLRNSMAASGVYDLQDPDPRPSLAVIREAARAACTLNGNTKEGRAQRAVLRAVEAATREWEGRP